MQQRAFVPPAAVALFAAVALILPGLAAAQEPEFTSDFQCNNWCAAGTNNYFPLWPGYALHLEGTEIDEDDGEMIDIAAWSTVLPETELVDGFAVHDHQRRHGMRRRVDAAQVELRLTEGADRGDQHGTSGCGRRLPASARRAFVE